jgi:hypothetical protein
MHDVEMLKEAYDLGTSHWRRATNQKVAGSIPDEVNF